MRNLIRSIVAANKLICFFAFLLLTIPLLFVWRIFFLRAPFYFKFQHLVYRSICFIFGLRVKVLGEASQHQVIYVGNHLSSIDIPVLGQALNAHFISKDDVKSWPIFGTLAQLSDTVFVNRHPRAAEQSISEIDNHLQRNRSLILFPEGTSSRGDTVLPFKSSLFELFLNPKIINKIKIQPFTITIDSIDGRKISTAQDLDRYSWYGDAGMPEHLWGFAKTKGAEVRVTLHPLLSAQDYKNRKEFALSCHDIVAEGLPKIEAG